MLLNKIKISFRSFRDDKRYYLNNIESVPHRFYSNRAGIHSSVAEIFSNDSGNIILGSNKVRPLNPLEELHYRPKGSRPLLDFETKSLWKSDHYRGLRSAHF